MEICKLLQLRYFLWTKKWSHWSIFQGQREPHNAELMTGVWWEKKHHTSSECSLSFHSRFGYVGQTLPASVLLWSLLKDWDISVSPVSIYNTENCWINSPAVPDLSCFSRSFEPCMSYSLCLILSHWQKEIKNPPLPHSPSFGQSFFSLSLHLSMCHCISMSVPKSIPYQLCDRDLSLSLRCSETSTLFYEMIDFQPPRSLTSHQWHQLSFCQMTISPFLCAFVSIQ